MTTPRSRLGHRIQGMALFAVLAAACLAAAPAASAADLTIAWKANDDDVTAGYDIEVLDLSGEAVQTLDAGDATRIVITDLADGELYRIRVRPYDEWGNRARKPSDELVTYPKPRLEAIDAPPSPGRRGEVVLRGANVAVGARVLSLRNGLQTGAVRVLAHDLVAVEVSLAPGAEPIQPGDFLVVNPVRRAVEYAKVHAQILDVNRSGRVEPADAALVEQAAGLRAGDAGFDATLDVNGDGLLDDADLGMFESVFERPFRTKGQAP
jgi:hypothetical protein